MQSATAIRVAAAFKFHMKNKRNWRFKLVVCLIKNNTWNYWWTPLSELTCQHFFMLLHEHAINCQLMIWVRKEGSCRATSLAPHPLPKADNSVFSSPFKFYFISTTSFFFYFLFLFFFCFFVVAEYSHSIKIKSNVENVLHNYRHLWKCE